MSQSGVLLVGHGTRAAAGIRCVEQLGRLVAERMPQLVVRHCFLELHERTIARAIDDLAAEGIKQLVVVPVLLFAAGHAKSDIPDEYLAAAAGRLEIRQADVFGCHPALVELSHQRYLQTVGPDKAAEAGGTCLLLVGRGSYDAQATAEMNQFAELRRVRIPGVEVQVAYIAMARPSVADAIGSLAVSNFERIVVQPHLLFPGDLFEQLHALVKSQSRGATKQCWQLSPLLAGDLGEGGLADRLLIDAIVDRATDALKSF